MIYEIHVRSVGPVPICRVCADERGLDATRLQTVHGDGICCDYCYSTADAIRCCPCGEWHRQPGELCGECATGCQHEQRQHDARTGETTCPDCGHRWREIAEYPRDDVERAHEWLLRWQEARDVADMLALSGIALSVGAAMGAVGGLL